MNPFRALLWIPIVAIAMFAMTSRNRHVSADGLGDVAILGGVDRRVQSEHFEGGTVWAILGGAKIDLRDVVTDAREVTVDATAILGGVEIRAPRDWEVVVNGVSVMGGFAEHGSRLRAAEREKPRLIVTGLALLGGVEVKH